ncbi:MAG: DNA polymerase III subunit [Dysgonamonadaceae bacterium]|jgi:DNA polymerase-3 subunit delta'|nr:DNA polymerase III subunit [Dysgonamonadaceae bacterium]
MFFRNIIGQTEIKHRLIQSVKDGYTPHARMIRGPEGAGKVALALAYARYLSCTQRGEDDACGVCPSCVKYNKLAHPDLHFVYPIVKNDKKKKEICDDYLPEWRQFVLQNPYFNLNSWLNFIGAENSQGMIYAKESDEIIRKLNLKAYESEYKIMIVWLPEKMHEACANKLLKMIEEPPSNTVFLLISENPDRVIGTIQSRTQSFPVPPIDDDSMMQALQKHCHSTLDTMQNIIHLANGSYLKAIELIESGEETGRYLELFISIMRNCWKRDVKNMRTESENFTGLGREKQKSFLSYAGNMIRENFFYRLNLPEINYLNQEEAGFAKNFSPYVNENNVIDLINELALAERHIESNVNPRMVFFDLSMKIAVLIKKN